jgi:hypothetical protein
VLADAEWAANGGVAEVDYRHQLERALDGRDEPRPDLVGTRDGTQSLSDGFSPLDLVFVDAAEFAAEDEPGADALVGDDDNVVIGEDNDVMVYGDGGAGKTTLAIDLSVHLAAGDDWLGIPVARRARVALIENEGPRPLFRRKLRRKLNGWAGSAIATGWLVQLAGRWARVSVGDEAVRASLAARIAELELDVVVIGPITRSGMNEAGTLQHVRDYVDLFADVRERSRRRVTFVLVHHENRAGQVSGAWEGRGRHALSRPGSGERADTPERAEGAFVAGASQADAAARLD